MPESTFWTLTRICHRNAYFVDPQQQSGSQNQQVGRRINKVGNRINKMGHRINKWGHHRIDKMGMGNCIPHRVNRHQRQGNVGAQTHTRGHTQEN